MAVGLVALGMMVSGCYGPFYLTRKVWRFNGEVSDNKWVVEAAFLVMNIVPIYQVAGAADALIFNSIEFWTGNNPLSEGEAKAQTRRIVRKDGELLLKREAGPAGDDLVVEQLRDGRTLSSVRFRRMGDHMAALNSDGAVLFNARTEADGRIVITDASGKQMASYSGEQAERMLRGVERF
jgi:hypothetical protein